MMDFQTALFYIFSAVLLFAGVRVVTARNPIHAALYLILAFFNAAAIWMLLQAEFLAIVLVLVYVGAVMVLFLFVVMMLNIDFSEIRQSFWRHLPVGLTVGGVVVVEMGLVIVHAYSATVQQLTTAVSDTSNTKALGKMLYTQYLYPFEVAAVILLVAMVAAIALTHRKRKEGKYQEPALQIHIKREDRVELVKMPVESSSATKSSSDLL